MCKTDRSRLKGGRRATARRGKEPRKRTGWQILMCGFFDVRIRGFLVKKDTCQRLNDFDMQADGVAVFFKCSKVKNREIFPVGPR